MNPRTHNNRAGEVIAVPRCVIGGGAYDAGFVVHVVFQGVDCGWGEGRMGEEVGVWWGAERHCFRKVVVV
jgi:hypothetical protein